MVAYRFKVVPFVGQVRTGLFSNEGAHVISQQLESAIQQHVDQGWEFVSVSQTNFLTQPGCLAGLLGSRVMSLTYDQVIFRRSSE